MNVLVLRLPLQRIGLALLSLLPVSAIVYDIESLGKMLRAFAMPVLTLCCVIVAQMMRMSRAAVVDHLRHRCQLAAAASIRSRSDGVPDHPQWSPR
jgi:ABC-type dipeptide/oligopeptide/nickel transport system permease component